MKKKPSLLVFNPHCELSILKNQRHYTPPKMIKKLEHDLTVLMLWLGENNDLLLVDKLPDNEIWLKQLYSVIGKNISFIKRSDFYTQKKVTEHVKPWGKSPSLSTELSIKNIDLWEVQLKKYFHRESGYKVLKALINENINGIISKEEIGDFYSDYSQLVKVIQNTFEKNPFGVILKHPFSSSGRGILVLKREEITPSVQKWIESGLKQQGSILLEPLLEKRVDFSLLFEKNGTEVQFLGGTHFLAGLTGQYFGAKLNEFEILFDHDQLEVIHSSIEIIKREIISWDRFDGPFGVDAIIYKDSLGKTKIQPCIEINPRLTMGHITLKLQEHILGKGEWRIITKHEVDDFEIYEKEKQGKYPLKIKNGKVEKGFLPLVDVKQVTNYYAYLLVTNEEV